MSLVSVTYTAVKSTSHPQTPLIHPSDRPTTNNPDQASTHPPSPTVHPFPIHLIITIHLSTCPITLLSVHAPGNRSTHPPSATVHPFPIHQSTIIIHSSTSPITLPSIPTPGNSSTHASSRSSTYPHIYTIQTYSCIHPHQSDLSSHPRAQLTLHLPT